MRSKRTVAGLSVALLLVALWAAYLRPPLFGGDTSYIMVTGESMEPTMYSGDLAVVRKQGTYEHGDIVAFRGSGGIIIHRILDGDGQDGFRLQGDNNNFVDPWQPTNDAVVGSYWLHIPLAGHIFAFLQQPLVLALFVGTIGFTTISFGSNRVPWLRKRRARRKGRAAGPGPFESPPSPGRPSMPSSLNTRPVLLAGLAAAIVFTCASIVLFVLSPTTEDDSPAGPEHLAHTLSFGYEAAASVSAVYPQGRLSVTPATPVDERQSIFTRLVEELHVDVGYALESNLESDLRGVFTATVEVHVPGAWSHELPVRPGTPFTGATIDERVTIDLEQVNAIVTAFEEETGYNAGSYDIRIKAEVGITGTLDGERFEDTYAASFAFTYGDTLIKTQSELVHSASEPAPGQDAAPLPIQEAALFGLIGTGDGPWRIGGGAGAILGLLFTVAMGTLLVRDARGDAATAIRTVNGERVLQATGRYGTVGTQRIVLASLADLAAVARREGEPVFHQRVDEGDVYFVPAGIVTYELRIEDPVRPKRRAKPQRDAA